MSTQIKNKNILRTLAKLIRFKMIHWEWDKILEGKEREIWTEKEIFEALSVPIIYKVEEKMEIEYFHILTIGGIKFLVLFDPVIQVIKVYLPKEGTVLKEEEPFLKFSSSFLEDLVWRNEI